ncbi:MAG: hypothetical protein ACK4KV_15955 [Rhodocyclaceae bacterium]
MTPESIEALMSEIEAVDAPDYGALALDEDTARHLMATHFCELDRALAEQGMSLEERLEMMAAIAAHTMTENLVLHVHRLRAAGDADGFREWMRRHGMG